MQSKQPATLMIGNSIIWAAAIIASALVLRGTEQATALFLILFTLGAASILMLQRQGHSVKAEWECVCRFFS